MGRFLSHDFTAVVDSSHSVSLPSPTPLQARHPPPLIPTPSPLCVCVCHFSVSVPVSVSLFISSLSPSVLISPCLLRFCFYRRLYPRVKKMSLSNRSGCHSLNRTGSPSILLVLILTRSRSTEGWSEPSGTMTAQWPPRPQAHCDCKTRSGWRRG